MPRSSEENNDSDTVEHDAAALSPTHLDDDGDVSNVAVGAASPMNEAQSPVEVTAPRAHHRDVGDGTGSTAIDDPSPFPSASADDISRAISVGPPFTSDSTPALLPGVQATVSGSPLAGTSVVGESVASHVAVASPSNTPSENRTPQHRGPPPQTLVLNERNLASFEDSVQRGAVPLRTDVINDRGMYGVTAAAMGSRGEVRHARPQDDAEGETDVHSTAADAGTTGLNRSVSMLTNHPARSHRDSSVAIHSEPDLFPAADAPLAVAGRGAEAGMAQHQDDGSFTTLAERYSLFTVDSATGSAYRRPVDALSKENLQLHLQELTSGVPVPLTAENIGQDLPKVSRNPHTDRSGDDRGAGENSNPNSSVEGHGAAARGGGAVGAAGQGGPGFTEVGGLFAAANGNRGHASLVVEPSEVAVSEVASTADTAALRATLRNSAHSDAAMEELWSTTSTHNADRTSQASWANSTDASQSLSKKSLRQLRRQLESGETPLRPEILAGLSSVAKAMGGRSEPSPSMVVEVPGDENGRNPTSRYDTPGLSRGGGGVATGSGGSGAAMHGHHRHGLHHRDDGDDDEDDDLDEEEDEHREGEEEDGGSGSMQFNSPLNAPVGPGASDAGAMSFHSTMVEAPTYRSDRAAASGSRADDGAGQLAGDERGGSGRRGGPIRSAAVADAMSHVGSVSNCGVSVHGATGARSHRPAGGRIVSTATRSDGGGGASSGAIGGGGVGAGGGGSVGSAGRRMNVSASLSANNGDLFGDEDVEDGVGEVDDDDDHGHRIRDDVDEVGDKSTTALSPDDDDVDEDDVEGHNEESVFMTEDGTEPHDDIAYLKRSVAEVMTMVKDTRKDQAQLSRQLQSIREDLNASHAGGRGASSSERIAGRSSATTTTSSPALAPSDPVNRQITCLRADMDEVRLYMREMQRSQMELLHKIERMQGRASDAGTCNASPSATSSQPPAATRDPLVTASADRHAAAAKIRLVVQCDAALLSSSTQDGVGYSDPAAAPSGSGLIRFLMPMSPDATVRQCKEEFLRRLREQRPTALTGLSVENTYLEMDGHALFDSLVLGAEVLLDSAGTAGHCFALKKS